MSKMAPRMSFIGVGNMGWGMCLNLVHKAEIEGPLMVYNRTRQRADNLANTVDDKEKIKVVNTIENAVENSDIVWICVGDDTAVNETIEKALKTNVKGKLFVDSSTVHPNTSERIGEKLTSVGAEFVAMPVFGPPEGALAGSLICVAAGPSESIKKIASFTKGVVGKEMVDFSDQKWGRAGLAKVTGNSFLFGMLTTLSETLNMADSTGLGQENIIKIMQLMFPGTFSSNTEDLLKGNYWREDRPRFSVDLAQKDVSHGLQLAQDSGASAKVLETTGEYLKVIKEHAGSNGDVRGIYGAIRVKSGKPYKN